MVTLRVEPIAGAQHESQHDHVRVSIIDNGPGIAKEDQTKIFEKFQQIDGSHTREHAGTGLGLAIAKDLARVIQGEIQLISEPGRGSMFSVIIPVHIDEIAAREHLLEASFKGSLARREHDPEAPGSTVETPLRQSELDDANQESLEHPSSTVS